jgi:TgpA N-terminal domain
VPGFGSKAEIDLSSINADSARVHASPLVQIGAILNQGEDVEVFQVQSDHPGYWRMVGLDLFDANGGWSPSPETGTPVQLQQPLQDVATGPSTVTIDATFTVKSDLAFTTLPIPYQPHVLVSSDESASWFPRSQTMSAADWPDAGARYRIRSVYPTPTAQELRATPFGTESRFPGETQLRYAPEIDEIRQLAEEWTAGEENGFDEVMAIQHRLHEFHYDKTVRYQDSLQGLVEFLRSVRRGSACISRTRWG